ncbi:hypothetical protein L3X38_034335 [Prunus dulcis]|uniref:Non-ATPase subunit 9 n=1 Tax=Prunus dulcis TaxID=3755 RepID=A0AAD4VJW6_PRUDU|nr:hypothetical protein L3X38_034335 [Prunus dulcis]
MPRVVKRKLQKLRSIVEYNKRGKGIGQAHSEMQSYIGVLARSRVPLVDMKWAQIPKDIKEQIWEAVDIAFVVGQGGKNSVLASAAKKWKDFKSTLTRHYILPYTNDKERLSQPPETYKFIEKAQWDAFVASRLSKDFESVHSQHAQIREKLEYNHRLSRKGYAGLEDQLEETMPGVEIDRSTLWKRARQDKHDVMHIEKNVCDSIIGTLLEIPGKNKDGIAARLDLLNMRVKADLQPEYGERRTRLPPGPWNLSRAEKREVCNSFYGMKVPEGYSSNIKNLVSLQDSRLLGLKSHDCHTLMQQLLPVAIRSVLEKPARYAITRLCFFFNAICAKTVDVSKLDKLEEDVVGRIVPIHFILFIPRKEFNNHLAKIKELFVRY